MPVPEYIRQIRAKIRPRFAHMPGAIAFIKPEAS